MTDDYERRKQILEQTTEITISFNDKNGRPIFAWQGHPDFVSYNIWHDISSLIFMAQKDI